MVMFNLHRGWNSGTSALCLWQVSSGNYFFLGSIVASIEILRWELSDCNSHICVSASVNPAAHSILLLSLEVPFYRQEGRLSSHLSSGTRISFPVLVKYHHRLVSPVPNLYINKFMLQVGFLHHVAHLPIEDVHKFSHNLQFVPSVGFTLQSWTLASCLRRFQAWF